MVGIISYGSYIPKYRIKTEEIAKIHGYDSKYISKNLLIEEKSVCAIDEDTITMAFEATLNAFKKKNIDKREIGAVYSGSESPVYAVKPNASIIGDILGIGLNFTSADIEFACKAGTAAMQMVTGLSKSGYINYGIAIGSDTAQSSPGDVLEFTASSGAASFLIGNNEKGVIAEILGMHSTSSDTPDFWRRSMEKYPKHSERFTGEPAYFMHVINCSKTLMQKLKIRVEKIDHVAFHTPNGKFPLKAGKELGFSNEKLESNMIVSKIGNTYSAASLLVLSHILDKANPGEIILLTSYGGGAGSDSIMFRVTNNIKKLKNSKSTQNYIDDKEYLDYSVYSKLTGII